MAILRIMVGLPGAGKSSHVVKMKGFDVVCPDDIRARMNNGKFVFDKSRERFVWGETMELVKKSLKAGRNAVVDATNVEKAARLRWIKIRALGLADRLEAVVVLASPASCISRIRFRGGGKASVIGQLHRYIEAWDPPTLDEGFDHVRVVRDRRRSKRRPRRRVSVCTG